MMFQRCTLFALLAMLSVSACASTVQPSGDGGFTELDAAADAHGARDAADSGGVLYCNVALCPEGTVCARPSSAPHRPLPAYRCLPLPPGCMILDRPRDRVECEPCLRVTCDRTCTGGGSRPLCGSSVMVDD